MSHRLTVSAIYALTVSLLAVPALAGDLAAAIAFSPSTGKSGAAWNFETKGQAEAEAYNQCGVEDCDTVMVFAQCGALAVGDGYGMGYAADLSAAVAEEKALANCSGYTGNCQITLSFCNEGY